MRTMLAVTRTTVLEHRMGLLIAASVCLLLLALRPIPGMAQTREFLGFGALVILPFSLALLTGASVLGREATERRLGFWFSRPVPALTLWAGKVAGALCIVVGAALLMVVPALVEPDGHFDVPHPIAWLLGLLLVFGTANVLSLAFRSGSRLVLADISLLAGWIGALYALGWRFLVHGLHPVDDVVPPFVVGVVVALLAGGSAFVVWGRTDARRGHLAMSFTLWGALGLVALALLVYLRALLAVSPLDLRPGFVTSVSVAPGARHAILDGWQAGAEEGERRPLAFLVDGGERRRLAFLVDLRHGRQEMLGAIGNAAWSADGRRAAWFSAPGIVSVADLSGEAPLIERRRWPGAFLDADRDVLGLSDSGALLLVRDDDRMRLMDVASLREVSGFDHKGWVQAAVHGETARVFWLRDSALHVMELSASKPLGEERLLGERETIGGSVIAVSPDGARVALARLQPDDARPEAAQVTIVDVASGAAHTVPLGMRPAPYWDSLRWMRDGRLACAADDRRTVVILSAAGHVLRRIPVSNERIFLTGEARPGELVFAPRDGAAGSLFVNADEGTVSTDPGMAPLWSDGMAVLFRVSNGRAFLVRDAAGAARVLIGDPEA